MMAYVDYEIITSDLNGYPKPMTKNYFKLEGIFQYLKICTNIHISNNMTITKKVKISALSVLIETYLDKIVHPRRSFLYRY